MTSHGELRCSGRQDDEIVDDLDPKIHIPASNSTIGDPSAGLCVVCRGIFDKQAASQLLCSSQGLRIKRPRKEMIVSALHGCPMCRELLCMPYGYQAAADNWKYAGPEVRCYISKDIFSLPYRLPYRFSSWPLEQWEAMAEHRLSPITPQSLSALYERYFKPDLTFVFRGDVSRKHYLRVTRHQMLRFRKKLFFEVAVQQDDPAASDVSAHAVNRDVRCKATYTKIRQWLADCDEHHNECKPYRGSRTEARPSYLLNVKCEAIHQNQVQLQDVRGLYLAYAALSYCWGTTQPKATITTNIHSYLRGIDVGSLPRSLQDAIFITRMLGLQYLWVDSLCIVQDSDNNKMHEIGRMEHIYHNAYVTISANSADRCDAGFLSPRIRSREPITIPFRTKTGSLGNVELMCRKRRNDPPIEHLHPPSEPIASRAWTFQESFMSRRMLIYSHYQLFWVCSEYFGKDGGRVERQHYFRKDLSSRKLKIPKVTDWSDIVEEYSARELTNPADKLPALSSIAGYFASLMNDTYLAGLWEKDICNGLCWLHRDFTPFGGTSVLHGRRPQVRRAPSWSFLAIDGKIEFKNRSKIRFSSATFGSGPFFTVLRCRTIPLSKQAPFGQVKAGVLVVKGRLLQVHTRFNRSIFHHMLMTHKKGDKEKVYTYGEIRFDTMVQRDEVPRMETVHTAFGDLDENSNLWCLLLCQEQNMVYPESRNIGDGGDQPYKVWEPWGLVLAKLSSGAFHRVGYFEGKHQADAAFRKQVPQVIVIV